MGVFDTMSGYVLCPHCSEMNRADIQFKWLEPMMATYSIGDFIDGHEPYHILDQEENDCSLCKQTFTTYAIGHFGHLYGFSNEFQLEKIKPYLTTDDSLTSTSVQLVISPSLQDNPKEVIRLFEEAYLSNPNESNYFIGHEKQDISDYVCRIHYRTSLTEKRPQVGDKVYYDNRYSRYSNWELKDEIFEVKEVFLDESSQLFSYTIQSEHHTFENIYEMKLLNETKRNKIIEEIEGYTHAIKNAANGHKPLGIASFHLRIHGTDLVDYLKSKNEIPQDFFL